MNRYKGPFTLALLFCALATMGATTSSSYLDDALATQRALAAAEPDNAEVLNDLGNLLALAGEDEKAEDAYRRALELEPGNPKTRYNLALMLQEEGLHKQAIAEFRQVIELEPNDAWAHYQLGRCYEEARRRSLAIQEYARAFDLDSSLASPRVNPHIIENGLATEALLVAYTGGSIAGQAPRMYEEPARIAEILTPPVPSFEDEPVEEEVQAAASSVRRVTVQTRVDDGSAQSSGTTETPATLGSQSPTPATASGTVASPASDADLAASRRALIQRRLAAQAVVQEATREDPPQQTSSPPTATSQEEAEAPEESEPEPIAPSEEPEEDDPPEQEEYEPAVPSTGQGGTRVYPAPYQPGAPSTGRLELELIPTRQDQLGAG